MMKTNDTSDKILVAGFGNPLLDISIVMNEFATGLGLLEKHDLQLDGQKEVDEANFQDILDALKRDDIEISYNPGGCAQNTMRIIQALVKHPKVCAFFGGLGNDSNGKFVEEEVKKCSVETRYAKHQELATGRVAAIINKSNRSLVANLGAADFYNWGHFYTKENVSIVEQVSIVYIEGFFITHSFEVAVKVSELGHSKGAVVAFNISGAYIAEKFPKFLTSMVLLADIIIGNLDEFEALAKVFDLKYSSIGDLTRQLHATLSNKSSKPNKLKLKNLNSSGKTVVLTQGKDPVFAMNNDTFVEYSIPDLNEDLIKDATGAGDAFAAGFLVGCLKKKPLKDSVSFGCKVAQAVVQEIGVRLPKHFVTENEEMTNIKAT